MSIFTPNLINAELTLQLNEEPERLVDARTASYVNLLANTAGWAFWVVKQIRGRCHYDHRCITIPDWAFHKGKDYLTWYVAHECAHAIAGFRALHGPAFMEALKNTCPEHCLHFETRYKPANAKAAGIANKPGEKVVNIDKKKYQIDPNDLF